MRFLTRLIRRLINGRPGWKDLPDSERRKLLALNSVSQRRLRLAKANATVDNLGITEPSKGPVGGFAPSSSGAAAGDVAMFVYREDHSRERDEG
jgi:hypothetical protein